MQQSQQDQEGINIYDRCNTMQDLNIHKSFPVESHCQETDWIRVYLPSRRSSLLSVTVTSSHSKRSKLGISGMFILSGLQGSCREIKVKRNKVGFTVAEKVQHITTEHIQTDLRLTNFTNYALQTLISS